MPGAISLSDRIGESPPVLVLTGWWQLPLPAPPPSYPKWPQIPFERMQFRFQQSNLKDLRWSRQGIEGLDQMS